MNKIDIFDVSTDNLSYFNGQVKKGNALVAFVAEWCGHCKMLHPKWSIIEKKIKNFKTQTPFIMARVSQNYLDKVDIDSQIEGFPTIRLYEKGVLKDEYTGAREVEPILNYIKSNINLQTESIKKNKKNKKNKKDKKNKKNKHTRKYKNSKTQKRKSKNRTTKRKKTKKKRKQSFDRLLKLYKLMKNTKKK